MARYYDRYEFFRFPKSVPRAAKGGIKAQSKGGAFAKQWWGKRWIDVLESFHIGNRLQRGRSYARRGQVVSIDIEKGQVHAKVQGSRPAPYKVSIQIKPIAYKDWEEFAASVTAQPLQAAKLLAGEMPQEIEQLFNMKERALFPAKLSDIKTECSCPDWSNPCKHIAAVYYLIGEEFDRDPFLIFKLRGMTREEFSALIGTTASAAVAQDPPEPLPGDPAEFWSAKPLPPVPQSLPPAITAALPRRLGRFPFWRADRPLLDSVEPAYRAVSQ